MPETNFSPANVTNIPADDFNAIITALENGIHDIANSKDSWWKKVWNIASLVVPEVEKFDAIFSSGADKKKIALELIDTLYFKYSGISWIPDAIEKMLLNAVAGTIIDKVVEVLNKQGILKHT